ncbi:hypothetical protein [Flavisolibacter nicotianae]|uniref:hypothetical protein n=1 Tax=Flavisolibacter nicotianae TaxID=2364882 RepID=UPI000EAFF635|nr:hypothetical protein [Flavisolibacter nicotianae]
MEKYRRRDLNDQYFLLEVFECPKEIILFAAHLGSDNVTIENFTHYGRHRAEFQFGINAKGMSLFPSLKAFDVDFSISKSDFLQFIDIWDEQGCYAVFHDTASLKFKATDLPEGHRYKALDNFDWSLEIAVPGSAFDGWGQIASPNKQIIDKIEEQLKNFR